ncbi:HET domain containing protein [Hyaloscypha variabilis]
MSNCSKHTQEPASPMPTMEHHNTRYKYEKLHDSETIRTLTLQGISNGIVECTIQQIGLSDGGYQALSYVWGSEETPFYAVVTDGKGEKRGQIPLTKNLNDALRDLWNAEELTSKVFWIDQICIDQEGEEKSQQVASMGQIYSNAKRVITYLGPVEDEDLEQEGRQLLERLDIHFAPNYDILCQMNDLATARDNQSKLLVSKLPDDLTVDAVNDRVWEWLVALCFGEWGTRLWIVQEQLLNTENLMLHGYRLLTWDEVVIIPVLFYVELLPIHYVNSFWQSKPLRSTLAPWELSGSFFLLWKAHRLKRQELGTITPFSGSLFENMSKFRRILCRDPRDHIFALLAISFDSKLLGITPDYSKQPKEPFLDASVSFFLHRQDVDSLTIACQTNNFLDPKYPSWAISSSRPTELATSFEYRVFNPHPSPDIRPMPRFQTHGENPCIVLTGRIVEQISLVTSPLYRSRSVNLGITDMEYWGHITQLAKTISEVLLNVGITLENAAAPARALSYHLWCWFRYLVKLLESLLPWFDLKAQLAPDLYHLIKALASLLLDTMDEFDPAPSLSNTEYDAARHIWDSHFFQGRSFCTTKRGRICSCMNKIETEDVIAAFRGADRLYVLRPAEGGRYRVVGDAYVDGLMFGEAYDSLDPDEVDYDIELI